jgi:hypothetical protein
MKHATHLAPLMPDEISSMCNSKSDMQETVLPLPKMKSGQLPYMQELEVSFLQFKLTALRSK